MLFINVYLLLSCKDNASLLNYKIKDKVFDYVTSDTYYYDN